MISDRDPDLPDVVEERRELGVAPELRAELEPVADGEHEIDDVTAVAPGVGVVCFDDVAQQERRPAIRVPELHRVVDPSASLACEEPDQAEQRQREQEGVRTIGVRRIGDDEPERGERQVDEVRQSHSRKVRPNADPERRGPCRRAPEVERELRDERCREDRPVQAPVG